jgi:hypothetical protein
MTRTIVAQFDGRVLVPEGPVDLPVGTPLTISIEADDAAASSRFADLRALAVDLPDAPNDLASQHDHYLYGSPKR